MKAFAAKTDRQRATAAEAVLNLVGDWMVTIHEPKRSNVRNAQLHAVITDVSKQLQWAGEWMEVEDWKRLLTAGWMRATNRKVKLVPAIDGHGFDVLYQRTSKLSEAECRELIQYVYAWGVDQGVKFKEPGQEAASLVA